MATATTASAASRDAAMTKMKDTTTASDATSDVFELCGALERLPSDVLLPDTLCGDAVLGSPCGVAADVPRTQKKAHLQCRMGGGGFLNGSQDSEAEGRRAQGRGPEGSELNHRNFRKNAKVQSGAARQTSKTPLLPSKQMGA